MTSPEPSAGDLSQADGMRFARNAAQAAASAGAVGNAELALQVAGLQESVMAQAQQLDAARREIDELAGTVAARDQTIATKDAELARMAQVNHGLQQRVADLTPGDEVAAADGSATEDSPDPDGSAAG